jgi:hypothetical protein
MASQEKMELMEKLDRKVIKENQVNKEYQDKLANKVLKVNKDSQVPRVLQARME